MDYTKYIGNSTYQSRKVVANYLTTPTSELKFGWCGYGLLVSRSILSVLNRNALAPGLAGLLAAGSTHHHPVPRPPAQLPA